MKTHTKKIAAITLAMLYIGLMPVSIGYADYTAKNQEECKNFSKGLEEYNFKQLTCEEITEMDKQNEECKNFSKDLAEYGKQPLNCAQIEKVDNQIKAEQDAEATCAAKTNGGTCADLYKQTQMKSGQGFKLPLDFLTLQTKDADGNLQKQGKSIFDNKEYTAKYGVLLGLLLRVIDILIYVIGSVALLTLIVAGIMMIGNHGDETWVSKGKGMMLYSILGVLFALLSFAVVSVIESILS